MSEYYENPDDSEYEEGYFVRTTGRRHSSRQRQQDNGRQPSHHRLYQSCRQRPPRHYDDRREVEKIRPDSWKGKPSHYRDTTRCHSPSRGRPRSQSANHAPLMRQYSDEDDGEDGVVIQSNVYGPGSYRDQTNTNHSMRKTRVRENQYPSRRDISQSHAQDVTSEELVEILSYHCNFGSSLLTLLEKFHLQPAVVRKIVSNNPQTFTVNREFIQLSPKVSLCSEHIGANGCHSKASCDCLHICPYYIAGTCKSNPCLFGHKWQTNHNWELLCKLQLHTLPSKMIHELVKIATQVRGPQYPLDICLNYNNSRCKFRECKRLHLCLSFVTNAATCTNSNCQLNHNLKTQYCQQLLKAHGMPTNETPRDIVAALIAANPKLGRFKSNGQNSRKNVGNNFKNVIEKVELPIDPRPSNKSNNVQGNNNRKSSLLGNDHNKNWQHLDSYNCKTIWSHHLKGNVKIPEICFHSVESNCKDESTGCQRLHAVQHFHWQALEQDDTWLNLQPPQVSCLELAFCDPAQDGVCLPRLDPSTLEPSTKSLFSLMGRDLWQADFQSMELRSSLQNKSLKLRRLCTQDMPQQTLKECTYLWYFMDINKKWIQYGLVDSTRNDNMRSSISSADIEKNYRQNPSVAMKFWTAQFHYSLDFSAMVQVNQQTDVHRKVRRRPQPHLKDNKYKCNQNYRVSQNLSNSKSQTQWFYDSRGDVDIPEICFDSVESSCKYESSGCQRLHAELHYHWQVCGEDKSWLNLPLSQVRCLEIAFCDPAEDGVHLPQLNSNNLPQNKDLFAVMGHDIWKADFQSMELSNSYQSKTLKLRRLCTQDMPQKALKECTYHWYFMDINNNWIEYGQFDSTRQAHMRSSFSSNVIETQYRQNPSYQVNFNTGKYYYILFFNTMVQVNQSTHKNRKVRRRPQPHLNDTQIKLNSPNNFPTTWDPMPASMKMRIVYLSSSSTEYQMVVSLLKGKLPHVQGLRIGRIQNPQMWIALQKKAQVMNAIVCQLFYGTKRDVIPKICYDNFDQHSQDLRTSQLQGKGTSFSTDAAEAYKNCQSTSNGLQYMFIARVAIDKTTSGNNSFFKSSINQMLRRSYYPIVNGVNNTSTIVKYDKQEYYPEYIITIRNLSFVNNAAKQKSC